MKENVTMDDVSIVLLGSFNPRIFHPSWLAKLDLISGEQADNADVVAIVQELSQFSAAYMNFDIQPSRFFVRTPEIYRDIVQDLVLSLFRQHLPHSPIWAVGLNRSFEFKCRNVEARTRFGSLLAPTAPWGAWGQEIEKTLLDKRHGGSTRVSMLQTPRPDALPGHVQADLNANMADGIGVFLEINNHFIVGDNRQQHGNAEAVAIVAEQWIKSTELAGDILDDLMATANAV